MTGSNSLIVEKIRKKNEHKQRRFRRVTIVLEADSRMPLIRGQWKRLPSGKIRAWYRPGEYEYCQGLFKDLKQAAPESLPNF